MKLHRKPRDDRLSAIPFFIPSGSKSPHDRPHLVGCAVDIRCLGKEQALRYAVILLDIAVNARTDFDEIIIEVRGSTVWLHFAVRPKDNRRKVVFCVK